MKNILKSSSIIFFLCILLSGCSKEQDGTGTNIIWADASVVWAGEPAACGCGWQILINNNYYKASNLAEDFEVDGLIIKLVYEQDTLYKFYCGDNPYPQEAIKIIRIEKH